MTCYNTRYNIGCPIVTPVCKGFNKMDGLLKDMVSSIHIILETKEYKDLVKLKKDKTWREYILKLANVKQLE